jgi:hypothetical protein
MMTDSFVLEKQSQDKWCWAAVSVSVARYFLPLSPLTQCRVALAVTGKTDCCGSGRADCNDPGDLEDALKAVGRWRETRKGVLTFEEIQQQIDAFTPVCVRIGWRGGGGHFVIVYGYRILSSGVQQVEVADPFFANSILSYRQLVTAYGSAEQPGGGQWTHTFMVRGTEGD